jgi:hypothetical protein
MFASVLSLIITRYLSRILEWNDLRFYLWLLDGSGV